jgi:hypothetical protein
MTLKAIVLTRYSASLRTLIKPVLRSAGNERIRSIHLFLTHVIRISFRIRVRLHQGFACGVRILL